ncbi:MAG: hypothetical protein J6B81_04500 [Spirochaetaceae bacterium]|nr:hypothetical protein [Spirochaetaceae bacterium]
MEYQILLLSLVGVFFTAFFLRRKSDKEIQQLSLAKDEGEKIDSLKEFDATEESFCNQVNSGEPYQHFLSLTYDSDCSIIQSMLSGSNIPSYSEFRHFNIIRGGGFFSGRTGTNIRLSILCKDYDDALEVVKGYLQSKISNDSIQNAKAKSIFNAAFATATLAKPTQAILGVTIYPKEIKS